MKILLTTNKQSINTINNFEFYYIVLHSYHIKNRIIQKKKITTEYTNHECKTIRNEFQSESQTTNNKKKYTTLKRNRATELN